MIKRQLIFLLIVIMIYLLLISSFAAGGKRYKLAANVFVKNKLFNYLAHLVYLDKEHSRLILQQGLPIIRVAKNKSQLKEQKSSSPLVAAACRFITDLPPSFFRFDSDKKIKQVASRFRSRRQLDKKVRKKIKAEGTHEDESKRKVKLDFWQTESSSGGPTNSTTNFRRGESKPPQKNKLRNRLTSQQALVGIYHSHTSENYGNKGYQSHAQAGERGTVVKVGGVLANYLKQEYGINTVHSTRVHDETYSQSYLESLETSQQMVNNHPQLEMVFDLHRDAIGKADEDLITTTINGQQVARIMIIVTGNDYLSNPHWQKNLAFAKRLAKKMEQMYPGLLREVEMIDNRRYNLHVHRRALLVEIGGAKNSLAEAKRSAKLLGNVIAELIQEGI